jgi:Xaa-Pro aminopeptidase
LAANEAAFKAAVPGAACEDLDAAARAVITKAAYGQYFNHRLGHGIGLDIHEDPYMVAGNKTPLTPGMAFSDEPGIYLPGKFGIRTEDILFMGKNGAERLTSFPHELQEI